MADNEWVGIAEVDLGGIASRHEFARALTGVRSQAGLSVREVAERAQASGAHSTIGDWFAGRGLPSASSRALFVRVLQVCGVTDPVVLRSWLKSLAAGATTTRPAPCGPGAVPRSCQLWDRRCGVVLRQR